MTLTDTKTTARSQSRTATYVWLVLSVLTVLSWWVGPVRAGAGLEPSVPITVLVLALGLVKCRLVFRYFMELRTAPAWLRWATDGWLVVLWGAVLAIYLW
ncbi:cytochrome C oxidase subunit IV family protein [Mycobacterium sp. 21AC1]|uniref:cytochrome C oxidase subunit IV family protein n=1 Tax=[Mycobacterium] appelbergii TaxID=2939269 RepID=UPI0029394AB1|nr:cytochrome C oxidase subunit IV family protein [Mycobacterium sp. 21AC1]MDV3127777.1 cytochrome C oxidase subunit IV family protein [Mycobacterium sp. 21AC1]